MGALEHWSEFNVAIVGAAGALAGLLIVAMSVNITQIIASRQLVVRAASAIAALLLAVVACAIGLVPGQGALAYGLEIVVVGIVAGGFGVRALVVVVSDDAGAPSLVARLLKGIVGLVPSVVAVAGGIAVLAGSVDAGLGLVAAAAIIAIIVSVVIAWIALVEVLR